MNNFWKAAIVVGASAIALNELDKYLKRLEDEPVETRKEEFHPDIEKALVHRLDAEYLSCWIDKKKALYQQPPLFIFSRVTDKMTPLLTGKPVPQGLDRESHMLLSALEQESKLPLVTCLINYTEIDDVLLEELGDQEYLLIKD